MSGPNLYLLKAYGNEEYYQQKLAERATQVPEDMVRLASIAAGAGVDMAKRAGIVGTGAKILVKSPTARKVVGGAALLGGGLLAAKGISKATQEMGRETSPQTFGGGRFGYAPAMGVNQYGQPQAGTPLM